MADTGKQKALELAIQAVEKAYGKGTILQGEGSIAGVEFFSSGCVSLDRVLGGGWAKGRIVEILGPESSGKTTVALHAIASVQQNGGIAAFVDAEHALDIMYAAALGVDTDSLLISQPNTGEQVLNVVKELTRSGALDLIVIDSVAALVPESEIEAEIGKVQPGAQARLMSQAMRMLASVASNTGTTLMFINQIRMKIGVMFGSPETTSGGNALKFYASQRLDTRRTGGVKDDGQFVANSTRAKVIKSKVSPPFREAEFNIVYGKGIDLEDDVITLATEEGLIDKSGSWYSYKGEKIGQGKTKVCAFLRENPEIFETLKEQLS